MSKVITFCVAASHGLIGTWIPKKVSNLGGGVCEREFGIKHARGRYQLGRCNKNNNSIIILYEGHSNVM